MDAALPKQQISSRDILIQSEDIEAACAFYEQKMGLVVFLREKDIIGLEAGASRIFIERGTPYGPVFEFFVNDLAAARQQLTDAGCTIDIEDPAVPKCYVRDPHGLIFNVAQR